MKNKSTVFKVLSLAHRLSPGFLTFLVLVRMIGAARPFVSIVFGSIILNQLIARAAFTEIMRSAVWMIVLDAILGLLFWGLDKLVNAGERVLADKITQIICAKSCTLDYDILEKEETMNLLKRAEEGMNSYGNIGDFCDWLSAMVESLCTSLYAFFLLLPLFFVRPYVGGSALAGLLNRWYSFLFPLAFFALHVFGTVKVSRRIATLQQDAFEKNIEWNRYMGYYSELMFDYTQGKYIRLYRMADMILAKFDTAVRTMEQSFLKLTKRISLLRLVVFFSSFLLQYTSYLYIGLKAVFSLIAVGDTLRYVSAYSKLTDNLVQVFSFFVDIDMRSKYLAYLYDYLAIENKRYDGTIPTEKRDDNQFEIEFRDVSFHYPNSDEPVLSHVSEKLTLGSKMAIVGRNGTGKSTFIKLLCRLYDPTEGEILLNGVDIRYYDYSEYARLFSVVFQDFNLFSFSVAQNVAASVEYDEARVLSCIQKAGFEERLASMPDGIRTILYQLEENGVEISGGEAQKLAIARAIYKDAPYVILDEPTSALDPVSEYEIYRRFNSLVEGKTAIYISHRMSSCRFCDRIYVFDQGKIVQRGAHEELMRDENGLYAQLWNAQAQYYNLT